MRSAMVAVRVAVAAALPLVAAACGSGGKFPASPVHAALTEQEAAELAQARLGDRLEDSMLVTIESTNRGYLLGYVQEFDAGLKPLKGTQLVAVDHDGSVRAYDFKKNK